MVKVKHLVVDSGAFIKNAPLHEYAENIYTVEGSVREIKDKATRQRLQFLPYALKIKEPSPDAYKHILEFSKKTGDFSTLSAVDLQIIALAYQLEKENVGTDHLNSEPSSKVTSKPCFAETQISGFYYPKEKSKDSEHESAEPTSIDLDVINSSNEKDLNDSKTAELSAELNGLNLTNDREELEDNESKESSTDPTECDNTNGNKENEADESSDDAESDSEEGWITSNNIVEMQKKMGAVIRDENSNVCVACITTDFAVQNVLMQIGLHVLSVDGMLIKNTRVFILRCHACFKTTSNTSKKFCPNCGNKTLKRVAVTLNEEGSKNIHINFRKPINIRGSRYSLPMPKGGKHVINPVVCEDQPIPHNRPPKMALQNIDVLSPDYEALCSPFAVNDVFSRAASLGNRPNKSRNQKKNPNEWSKRTGNKKGRK